MYETLATVGRMFRLPGELKGWTEIKNGNVNRTYRVDYTNPDGTEKSYLAQRVNTYAFRKPTEVMDNIDKVTGCIRDKKPGRISLHFHHTEDRKTYFENESGFWRVCNYIHSATYDRCDDLNIIRRAGEAFGEFRMLLADFDPSTLHETIPHFHDTRDRYAIMDDAIARDPVGRVAAMKKEIEWANRYRDEACLLTDLLAKGELPLRVTHNDTKINNVLFDSVTGEPLTIIDLDTVMPGVIGNDFGDAIRFAGNYVAEDCPDTEHAGLNLDVFRSFAEGYLTNMTEGMTEKEIETLPMSCFCLTAELAVRWITDYILGDPYFKINYPEHNLVRTRCQIALADDLMRRMNDMQEIIARCVGK